MSGLVPSPRPERLRTVVRLSRLGFTTRRSKISVYLFMCSRVSFKMRVDRSDVDQAIT
jgi:hypothetical protein